MNKNITLAFSFFIMILISCSSNLNSNSDKGFTSNFNRKFSQIHEIYPNAKRDVDTINIIIGQSMRHFNYLTSTLSQGGQEKLTALANVLDKNNAISIHGHTCDLGEAEANLKLSEVRCNLIKNHLISKNASLVNFDIVGYGESNPLFVNDSEENRGKNRRVEIKITGF